MDGKAPWARPGEASTWGADGDAPALSGPPLEITRGATGAAPTCGVGAEGTGPGSTRAVSDEADAEAVLSEELATGTGWSSERWWRFLAAATGRLTSIEYDATVARIARVAVPAFATWCVLRVPEAGRVVVEVCHADPAKEPAAHLADQTSLEPEDGQALLEVLQTGEPIVRTDVRDGMLPALARSREHLQLLRELGCSSYMIVPLVADGRVLGTLALVSASDEQRYEQIDLSRAQVLAARCAAALANARQHQQVREAVHFRDELLAAAAHDLRTPLTSVKAYAQGLRLRAHRSVSPDQSTFVERLDRIDEACTRMAHVIDDLTDVARLQLGKPLALARQWVDLPRLLRRVAQEHERSTGRDIRVVARQRGVSGWWDAARLERVLDNLLSNAIKFSPSGDAVTVALELEEGPAGPWAVITVSDRGVGIPANDLPRLFRQFERGVNVANTVAGTGIGLAVAAQIVALHGGHITVESREDEGTSMTVRLPLHAEEASMAA